MSSLIPTYNDLSFYSDPVSNKSRYDSLVSTFRQNYGGEVEFFARSPGRVNLMGDHIDYNFFSVLPMAIDVDVVIAVRTTKDAKINISNTDAAFKAATIELPANGDVVEIDQNNFSWGNYFTCGLIVAHKFIAERYPELVNHGKSPLKGMDMTFSGTVPTGGGLSSSAAICVASTLAVLRANGLTEITKDDLTKITVVTEHYVGVNTGGMDQCASVYGESSKALLIQFKPQLKGIAFKFPSLEDDELIFLISNSLVKANKHETAPIHYNLRVVEIAIASDLLGAKFGLDLPKDSNVGTGSLRGFMDCYFASLGQPKWDGSNIEVGIERLSKLSELVEEERIFTAEQKIGFSTEDAAKALGVSVDQFTKTYLSKFEVRYDTLKLYQRTKHVFDEALKVLQCLKLLASFSSKEDPQQFFKEFGDIMNKSQHSLDTLFNSSHEKLNDISRIALKNGSFGSRTTGAGFGGSMVHLTSSKRLQGLKDALVAEYYQKEFPGITETDLNEAMVVSKPAVGSCLIEMQ